MLHNSPCKVDTSSVGNEIHCSYATCRFRTVFPMNPVIAFERSQYHRTSFLHELFQFYKRNTQLNHVGNIRNPVWISRFIPSHLLEVHSNGLSIVNKSLTRKEVNKRSTSLYHCYCWITSPLRQLEWVIISCLRNTIVSFSYIWSLSMAFKILVWI
jgi:hypothetical protein